MRSLSAAVAGILLWTALLTGADIPRPSPEYAIQLTDGRQLLLSGYRGRVVALMFISTECPHCQKTCQLLDGLQAEYGPRGFQVAAVAFNEMANMLVPEFIKRFRLTFPVGWDKRDPVFAFLDRSPMLRTYVPMLVFVDRSGTIRGQYLGDDKFYFDQEKNIRATVEQLLKEPAKRAPATARSNGKKKTS
jgi:thiol-disulfide isomerase/thioredoxin